MSRPNPEQTIKKMVCQFSWQNSAGQPGSSVEIRDSIASHRAADGSNTANFFNLQPWQLPERDYYLKLTKRSEQKFIRHQQYRWGSVPWLHSDVTYAENFGVGFTDYSYNISHSQQAYNKAMLNAMERVRDQKLNLAQAMAEHQKTIDLVASTAIKLAKAYSALRKGNFGRAQRALTGSRKGSPPGTSLAQNWLALQYGWKPLLGDVHGAVKHLLENPRPPRFTCTGRSQASDSNLQFKWVAHGGAADMTATEIGYDSRAMVKLRYQVANHTVHTMSQLGFTDPASLAWELLPWSFAADWVFPIGDYLMSRSFADGLTWLGGVSVKFTRNNWVTRFDGRTVIDSSYIYTHSSVDLCTSSNVLHNRDRIIASPEPIMPSFKNPLSKEHLANALALLRTSVRR